MRNFVWTAAIVGVTASSVLAASGTIRNSAHDLSSSSTYARQTGGEQHYATGYDQLCAFCHTPHKADLTVTNAPLWNRTTVNVADADKLYNSASLTAAAKKSQAFTTINQTDVPLCMSCHDGSSITDPLKNDVKGTDSTTFAADGLDNLTGGTGLLYDGANALTNDHPVGFNYDNAAGADTGLHTLANAKTKLGTNAFFGAGANMMWCASCHAVHSPGTGFDRPFLRISNAGSDLCLACHNK